MKGFTYVVFALKFYFISLFQMFQNMRINAPHRKLMFDGTLTLMIDKDHSLGSCSFINTITKDCVLLIL